MRDFRKKVKRQFPLYGQGWLVYVLAMAAASVLCLLLQRVSTSDVHVPLVFVLAVLIVSLLTRGYFYGLLAALTSVFAVNFAFTEPYYKMDFTAYGYPLTFMTMTAVGCAVSALTSLMQERQRLRTESEREKVRANLLRAVSHDLRTPLTGISGSLTAVLENRGELDEEQTRTLLSDAREEADWLCRMVENLLSVTRIGDGPSGKIHKQAELPEEVIGAAVMAFRKHNPGLSVKVSVPEEPVFVPMDPVLIQQVLGNLMENAVAHGGCVSAIELRAEMEPGVLRITVADDGSGIDKALLEHLFDGSRPLHDDTERGMGIGLTVCRTIVEAHGGRISAHNRPEGGAEISFTLPTGETANDDQG